MGERRPLREQGDEPDAGDALLHPVVLVALGLLLLNDHLLKATWPGPLTGKVSDVAGLAFAPILLVSAWELGGSIVGRWHRPTIRALLVAVVLTAIGFALVKAVPSAAAVFGWSLGVGQWLLAFPGRALLGQPMPPVVQAAVVVDPTDLVALPGLALALWVGTPRVGAAKRAPVSTTTAGPSR